MGRTTSITLGDHFGPFVARLVESGRYGNVSDVVRAGLRQLQLSEFKMARFRRFLETCPVDDEPRTAEDLREEEEDLALFRRGEAVPGEVIMAEVFPDEFDAASDVDELRQLGAAK